MAIGPVDKSLPLMVELKAFQSSSDGQHASEGACSRRQSLSLKSKSAWYVHICNHCCPTQSLPQGVMPNMPQGRSSVSCLRSNGQLSDVARLQSFRTSADPRNWSAKGQVCTVHYVVLTEPAKSMHYCRRIRCATTRPYQPIHKVVTKERSTGFECR